MVSPPFKDGDGLSADALSDNGTSVLVHSLGIFGETESGSGGAPGQYYEFSRSGSGWVTSAINPPQSLFPSQKFIAVSPNLGSTLWLLRTGSQSIFAEDLYVREADGSLVEIGSLLPPAAEKGPPAGGYQGFPDYGIDLYYADASADLSHVLFTVSGGTGLTWPGDTTHLEPDDTSLYEYVGRGQARPTLVGVSDGSTIVNGEPRPAGQLISDCGTYLGSLRDDYNAVSADGATVFFTATSRSRCPLDEPSAEAPEANELFARLDQVQTVPISEPSSRACAQCKTPATVADGRREGTFAGASEDGSKVFFLTEQELLSGAEGMNLYEYDFDNPESNEGTGRIVRVSTGSAEPEVQGVARVSEDGSHVYFVARGLLTKGPREGVQGKCLAGLGSAEKLEETGAEEQEAKAEPVTKGSLCRPKQGRDNLYVFERDAAYPGGRVAFIATLAEGDSEDWGAEDLRPVQATPDGRFLVFDSIADLMGGDPIEQSQVFEYDAESEQLARVSIGEGEEPEMKSANENGSVIEAPFYEEGDGPSATEAQTGRAVSDDGSTVMFISGGALTSKVETAEGVTSVYEYHSGGSIDDGAVYLLSDGVNTRNALSNGLDASGQDAFFATADSLLLQDVDTQYDIYDARIDGGFPTPDPPAGCVGEACVNSQLGQQSLPPSAGESFEDVGSSPPLSPLGSVLAGKAVRPLTRAQRLTAALKACKREPRHRRAACESAARRRYGARTAGARKSSRRGK